MCMAGAPDDFALGSGSQSTPRAAVMTASDMIMAAAESCPVEAIGVMSATTGEPLFPPD